MNKKHILSMYLWLYLFCALDFFAQNVLFFDNAANTYYYCTTII